MKKIITKYIDNYNINIVFIFYVIFVFMITFSFKSELYLQRNTVESEFELEQFESRTPLVA